MAGTPEDDMQLDWLRFNLSTSAGYESRESFQAGWKAGASRRDAEKRIADLEQQLELEKDKYLHDTAVLAERIEVYSLSEALQVGEVEAHVLRRDKLVQEIEEWWSWYILGGPQRRGLGGILEEYHELMMAEKEEAHDEG